MDTGVVLMVVAIATAVVVLSVVIAADRAGRRESERRREDARRDVEMSAWRLSAQDRAGERAAYENAFQSASLTAREQAEAMARSSAAAMAALTGVAGAMGRNDRLAIEALHTQAVVAEYSRIMAAKGMHQEFAQELAGWNEARIGAKAQGFLSQDSRRSEALPDPDDGGEDLDPGIRAWLDGFESQMEGWRYRPSFDGRGGAS